MTRILIKTLILIGFIVIENQSFAQWNENGNALTNTGIFGSTTNWDVLFRTDNVNRMRLMQSSTNTVDGYFYDNSGFLGISQDPAFFTSKISTSFSLRSIQWIFQVSKSTRCDRSRKVDPYQISFQT